MAEHRRACSPDDSATKSQGAATALKAMAGREDLTSLLFKIEGSYSDSIGQRRHDHSACSFAKDE